MHTILCTKNTSAGGVIVPRSQSIVKYKAWQQRAHLLDKETAAYPRFTCELSAVLHPQRCFKEIFIQIPSWKERERTKSWSLAAHYRLASGSDAIFRGPGRFCGKCCGSPAFSAIRLNSWERARCQKCLQVNSVSLSSTSDLH